MYKSIVFMHCDAGVWKVEILEDIITLRRAANAP
jgi:hypothetical protein